ncbi:MAG: phage coat protein [Bacilli bacterium]|nr:phage coat protein [Bacilli bacterium]
MPRMFDEKTFNGEVFQKYVKRVPKHRTNELLKSGVLAPNQELATRLPDQVGGNYIVEPMTGLIGGKALNYDGKTDIVCDSTDTFTQGKIVVGRAKGWVEKDFSADITGKDFMDNVAEQVAGYWEDIDQDTIIAILKGIFAMDDTVAPEFATKHTYEVDGKFEVTTLNSATNQALGQNKKLIKMIIMHSDVATNLENLQLLEYLKYTDKDGITRDLEIATLNGRLVIIDDNMPVDETTGVYTTYALGKGAIEYTDCGVYKAYAMVRDEKKNGGQTELISKQRKLFAPMGISFTNANLLSPEDTDLANGANWALVNNGKEGENKKYFNHKFIPIVQIKTKG